MKASLFAIVFTLAAVVHAHADEEGAAWCKQFTENSGISDEPCECVVSTVQKKPELAKELYVYANRDEYVANGSAELKELLKPCVGDSE